MTKLSSGFSGQTNELSTDIHTITAEIKSYQQIAGQAIFEIGRRLKHVKENDLVHGQWERWCREEIGMTPQNVNRFVKVYDELGDSNRNTYFDLGVQTLYLIATLPEPEREKLHTIPSTGETKTVDEMTVRELREVKRQLKAEQAERARLESENERLIEERTNIEESIDERIAEEVRNIERQVDDLHTPKDDLMRQMDSSTTLSKLYVEIEHLLQNKLAPIRYSRALTEAKDSRVVINNLSEIIETVEQWADEMRSYLPNGDYIDAEVIE